MELHLYGVKRENSYGEFFTSIGLNIQHKYAWGIKDDEPIYDITFDISEDQSEHKPGIDYWGWMDYDKNRITMVWSNWAQFFTCFPYGVEASEKSGQGKAYRLKIINYEIKEENGKTYAVRKRLEYPKTYEECCEIIGIEYPVVGGKPDGLSASTYRIDEIRPFIYLFICRDAYWKIAGEQMGLGKSWSPSKSDNVYCIFRLKGEIVKDNFVFGDSLILEFPTAEMRNAFYENFKDLIEKCKKLL